MSIAKLGKSKIVKISQFLLIFIIIFGFARQKFVLNFRRARIWQKPAIYSIDLSTVLLLTGVLVFAMLRIVNPPRAVFGPCGAFIFDLKIVKSLLR